MSQKPVARVGDMHVCPIPGHGTTPIVSGSPLAECDGQKVARVGDKTGCGATIVVGSSISKTDGKPTAYLGSTTDHGGKIISGCANGKVQP